jgi:hypothetical protein
MSLAETTKRRTGRTIWLADHRRGEIQFGTMTILDQSASLNLAIL